MRTMGVKRRVSTWRARADMAERMLKDKGRRIVLTARGEGQCEGYIEALRKCADELEYSVSYAQRRPRTGH